MSIQLRIVSGRKDLTKFVKFQREIYKGNSYWVPPLIKDEINFLNPDRGVFFKSGAAKYFMVYDNDKPVGRISAHLNYQYEKCHDKETGFFGFFECVNDPAIAKLLLNAAKEWLKSNGKKKMLGPMNFSIYDASGMLCQGFDSSPVILLPYNPPYYNELLIQNGFSKVIDWYAFLVKKGFNIKPSLFKVRDRVLQQNCVTIQTLDMKKLPYYVKLIGQIFEKAWAGNWGHVPLTEHQLEHMATELKYVVVPELTFLALINNECVGFSLTVKDANPALKKANGRLLPFGIIRMMTEMKKIKRLRTIAMGVLEEYRNKGIDIAFYLDTIKKGTKMGYEESECSVIVETNNRMIRALEDLNAERYKTYRFYEKNI